MPDSSLAHPAAAAPASAEPLLGEREAAMLQWRSRRGLLENDLYIENFFARHRGSLTARDARGLSALMDLADNDLLDLLLARREPAAPLDTDEVRQVLAMLRAAGGAALQPRA